jgi:hypothetical protein
MYLSYEDTTTKTEQIVDETYEPGWKAPPDAKVKLMFSGINKNLANSWERDGSEFSKGTVSIDADGINSLTWIVYYKDAQSVKGVKVFNPFPWPARLVVRHMNAALDTVVGSTVTFVVPSFGQLECDISAINIANYNAGAEYLYIGVTLYDSTLPFNEITINAGSDGFFLPFPMTEEDGIPVGPTVAIDSYNIVDQYGLLIAGVAGALTGVAEIYAALNETSVLKELAAAAGVGVASLAGIIVLGIYNNWLDLDDVMRLLLPALGTALTPMATTALLNTLPNKYTGMTSSLLSLGIGGAGVAGELASAWVLINMIDDIEIVVDA